MKVAALIVSAIAFFASAAHANQEIAGKVTSLDTSFMPGGFIFRMDTGNAACPAGKALQYGAGAQGNPENTSTTYATVLSALLSGKRLRFYIIDNDTNCVGQAIQIDQ